MPTTHGAHWRSATTVPAVAMPSPITHVLQDAHSLLPSWALNWPSVHAAHVRSLLVVAALLKPLPAMQGSLTASQTEPSSVDEYETESTHAVHWRSE